MHKHELAFRLSPHITNLNLNEPPLQIDQQAMTLHPPPPGPTPSPPARYPQRHIFTSRQSFHAIPQSPTFSPRAATRTPFLPQPHQLHSIHLIKRGRTGRRRKAGGSLYQDDFLRWLSQATKPSQVVYLPFPLCSLYVKL
ncbi:hypothetical protein NL108_006069 [Boleophthalmus pectinirostris]|nr:hypothetical protein NL108_006069 [Boleophthalmus pectinirostris]